MTFLDPKVATEIKESDAGRKFLSFLGELVLELDSISDIDLTDPIELSIEVKSRLRSKEKLEKVFEGLLTSVETPTIKDERDSFAVEVVGEGKK